MKKTLKKALIITLITLTLMCLFSSVFAQVTDSDLIHGTKGDEGLVQRIAGNGLSMFILQPIITAITVLIKFFISIVIAVMGLVFQVSGIGIGTSLYFPLPHHMVFNLIPMLDPNFINPTITSANLDTFNLTEMLSGVISPIYFTMISIATSVFVVIALLIGIKLAISISASEKAQYKNAMVSWITGLALLFTGHFLMSGIFYVNEQIVSNLYQASEESIEMIIKIPKDASEAEKVRDVVLTAGSSIVAGIMLGPIAGVAVAISLLAGSAEYDTMTVKGFEGVIVYYLQDMIYNNNPISTLIIAVMLGQIIALTILYVKRMIYAVILGLLFPFVIIVDTYKKVTAQKSGGLFEKWLAQFAITIFMQSIHAVLMFIIVMLTNGIFEQTAEKFGISQINLFEESATTTDQQKLLTIIMIIQMGAIASLTRLEGLIKEYIGVPDAKAGSLKNAGMLGYSAVRMGSSAIKNVSDNFSGVKKGRANVLKLRNKMNKAKDMEAARSANEEDKMLNANIGPAMRKPTSTVEPLPVVQPIYSQGPGPLADGKIDINDLAEVNKMTGTDNPGLVRIQNQIEKLISEIRNQGISQTAAINNNLSANRLNRSNETNINDTDKLDKLTNEMKKINTPKGESIDDLAMQLKEAESELTGKRLAQIASFGFVPGSIALGLGMTSSMTDTAAVSSAIINVGDRISETIGKTAPRGAQNLVIQNSVNYEEYLQQKIISSYSSDKYTRKPESTPHARRDKDADFNDL